MSVEEVITAIRERVTRPMVAAFVSALLLGFVTHISAITNLLMNWDSMTLMFGAGFALTQGKWFYAFLDQLHGIINVGSITIPLAILFCAISAALLVKVLDIKKPIHAGFLGAALAVFPSTMVICAYNSEDIFLFAVLLSVFAVYVLDRCKFGFVGGVVLLALSLGIYQAYIGFTAAILLMMCMKKAFTPQVSLREVFLQAGKYILFLALSIILYYIVLQVTIAVSGTALSEYRGISDTLSGKSISPSIILTSIGLAYSQFTSGVWMDFFGTGGTRFVFFYRLAAIFVLLCLCLLVAKRKLYRKPGHLLTLILFIILFPLAVNIIEVLSFGSGEYLIMTYPFVMCVALLILFVDMLTESEADHAEDTNSTGKHGRKGLSKTAIAAQWVAVGICACLVFNWYIFDNQGYTRMKVSYDEAYSISMGMIDDITSCEGYNESSTVAVMDLDLSVTTKPGFVKSDIFSAYDPVLGIPDRSFAFRTDGYWVQFVSTYMGYTFNLADDSTKEKIAESEEYKNMPTFPSDGSTRVIDGIIVIKLSER